MTDPIEHGRRPDATTLLVEADDAGTRMSALWEAVLREVDPRHLRPASVLHVDCAGGQVDAITDRLPAGAVLATSGGQLACALLSQVAGHPSLDPHLALDPPDELVLQVVDDLYLRAYARPAAAAPAFSLADAEQVARAAISHPWARLAPPGLAGDSDGARVRFARAVRLEVAHRMRAAGLHHCDGCTDDLLAELGGSVRGPALRRALGRTLRAVLVVDAHRITTQQWQILAGAVGGRVPLLLAADPTFASDDDSAAYRSLRSQVDSLVRIPPAGPTRGGLDWLVRPVPAEPPPTSAPRTPPGPAGTAEAEGPPVEQRQLAGTAVEVTLRVDPAGPDADQPEVVARICRDAAQQVAALLAGSVAAADIVVVVPDFDLAEGVSAALDEQGIPAASSTPAGKLPRRAAQAWRDLLLALEQPGRSALVRCAILTPFFGTGLDDLVTDPETTTDAATSLLRAWGQVLADAGVLPVLEQVAADTGLYARLAGQPGGLRLLGEIRAVAAALHARALAADGNGLLHRAAADLVGWLDGRGWTSTGATAIAAVSPGLAAVAVEVSGSQPSRPRPVVLVPFGWLVPRAVEGVPTYFTPDGQRVVDVRGPGAPAWDLARRRGQQARAAEADVSFREACRSATGRVIVWTTRPPGSGPVHRALAEHWAEVSAGGSPHFSVAMVAPALPSGQAPERSPAAEPQAGPLAAARLDRVVADDWRRTSFSALTRELHALGPALASPQPAPAPADPDAGAAAPAPAGPQPGPGPADPDAGAAALAPAGPQTNPARAPASPPPAEPAPADTQPGPPPGAASPQANPAQAPADPAPAEPAGPVSPMAELPGGAALGTLVHAALELVDWDAADRPAQLRRACQLAWRRTPLQGVQPAVLADALGPALETPLGRMAEDRTLWSIPASDRLAEMSFEFALPEPNTRRTPDLAEVAVLLRDHLAAADPLRSYPERLLADGLGTQTLRGFLSGSIDLVARVGAPAGQGSGHRYLVADYKTNRLGAIGPTGGGPDRAADYFPARLAEAMMASHYPLQALIYQVALHRFLRWRLPGYDPAEHLGGVVYLFLRGMCGPDTPVDHTGAPAGVFGWHPPAALTCQLSDLMGGR